MDGQAKAQHLTRWDHARRWLRAHRPRLRMLPFYGFMYQRTQRAMHRVGLHKTRRYGPMIEDGAVIEKCEWCGISRVVTNWEMERAAEYMRRTGNILVK